MNYAEKKKKASAVKTIIVLLIFFGVIALTALILINYFMPGSLSEIHRILSPPQNTTIIIENQTVHQTIDQRTGFWDFAKQVGWMIFGLALAIMAFLVVFMLVKKKSESPLTKEQVIKIHRDIINADIGHHRLAATHSEDEKAGTFLLYHAYHDGIDPQTAKSYPRAVTFWALEKLPQNTPISLVPKHLLVWVDTSTRSKDEAINSCTGPVHGQSWDEWQKWKHEQNLGLTGAKSSPITDQQILTPEEQQAISEQWKDLRKAIFNKEMI